nr:YitT family protein [Neobacillus sp. Marseille-Q6967]
MAKNTLVFKTISFFLGLLLMSLGSVFMIEVSSLGVQPWDVLHISLHNLTPISIGGWSIIIGAVLVFISLLITKQKLKIGTILDTIFVGVFIDIIIYFNIINVPNSYLGKLIYLLIGTIIIAFGAGLVIVTNLGAGPRDTFMLAIQQKLGISIKMATSILETSALFIGFLMGGPLGLGTFIFCFLIGPCIEISIKLIKSGINYFANEKNQMYYYKKNRDIKYF